MFATADGPIRLLRSLICEKLFVRQPFPLLYWSEVRRKRLDLCAACSFGEHPCAPSSSRSALFYARSKGTKMWEPASTTTATAAVRHEDAWADSCLDALRRENRAKRREAATVQLRMQHSTDRGQLLIRT